MKNRFFAVVLCIGLICPFSVSGAEDSTTGKTAVVKGVSTEPGIGGCLLVFSTPSQSAPKLGFIVNGDEVQVHEINGFFSRITCTKFPDGGWVWNTFLFMKDDLQTPTNPSGPEPLLLKSLREQADPAVTRDAKKILPHASPGLVASFIAPILKNSHP